MFDITKIDTSGWTKEQLAKLDELKAKQAEIAQKKALLAAEEEAKRNDPAVILEEEIARQEAEEAALKVREREVKADVAYRQAIKKHGKAMVARIRTEEGSIVLHALSSGQFDELSKRLKDLSEAEDPNIELIARNALREQVDFPPLPEFDELVTKYPGLWIALVQARDALATGAARVTSGKG
jgi:hypothetical protein